MRHSTAMVASGVVVALALAGCGTGTGTAAPTATGSSATPAVSGPDRAAVAQSLAALEHQYDATVGVVATDTMTGATISYNGDRRFGYASTLKAFAAAQFLRSVHGAARDERVHWTAADVTAAGHSPVTEQHIADGLTYTELVDAAVRQSDNTALNLVLTRIGGPKGLDDALAALGDATTEVVNDEPDLNTIEPGSTEDTTTPAAFTADLARVFDGHTLNASDTAQLRDWMSGNATGDTLIRADAPTGWAVADKSGGAGGIRNDIARVTTTDGDEITISVLTTKHDPAAAYDDALVAKSAAAVLRAFTTED